MRYEIAAGILLALIPMLFFGIALVSQQAKISRELTGTSAVVGLAIMIWLLMFK